MNIKIKYNFHVKYIQFIAQMSTNHNKNLHFMQVDNKNNLQFNDISNQFISPNKKSQLIHGFSQPKNRNNVIKINKARLPPDFFPKCTSVEKKLPNFKLHIKDYDRDIGITKQRRAESQRLHNSPQKTSFFGFFDNEPNAPQQGGAIMKKFQLKRKFQTRQQAKRQNLQLKQLKRRFTPGYNFHSRNQLLDLFPATYDEQMTEIVISNSNSRVAKFSPRKQHSKRHQQGYQVIDPEKEKTNQKAIDGESKYQKIYGSQHKVSMTQYLKKSGQTQAFFYEGQRKLFDKKDHLIQEMRGSSNSKNIINLKSIEPSSSSLLGDKSNNNNKLEYTFASETLDLHNITFFNAKSTYLPPLKKS